MVGIVSYGVAIPRFRIKTEEIAMSWGKDPHEIGAALGIMSKAVPGVDEDAATLAVEAGKRALDANSLDPHSIGAVFVGSESHPYAVNPTSTIVGEYLGVGRDYFASDLEFACKAGTTGVQVVSGLLEAGKIDYGMAIGTDTAQAKPHDILEYTAGAGAGAYILGKNPQELRAELIDFVSYSSDTSDFWRRDGMAYPSHGGRFTGEPAYFTHVLGATKMILEKVKMTPEDFDYCVFHMPNGKFPQQAAKRIGFTKEQIQQSFLVPHIGNPYSASSMIGLASVLDIAKPGQKIFMVSYGSGAGADAFVWNVLKEKTDNSPSVSDVVKEIEYVTYAQYLKMTGKI